LSIHADTRGRADSQANPARLNGGHDYADIFVNHDLLADAPTEH
jgi:hypothetical protein